MAVGVFAQRRSMPFGGKRQPNSGNVACSKINEAFARAVPYLTSREGASETVEGAYQPALGSRSIGWP